MSGIRKRKACDYDGMPLDDVPDSGERFPDYKEIIEALGSLGEKSKHVAPHITIGHPQRHEVILYVQQDGTYRAELGRSPFAPNLETQLHRARGKIRQLEDEIANLGRRCAKLDDAKRLAIGIVIDHLRGELEVRK